jgi:cytochrome c oxidase assembly protein subunit 15
MPDSSPSPDSIPRGSRALVLGFAAALAMWIVAFAARTMPHVPPVALVAAMLALLAAAAVYAGRLPRSRIADGAAVGLVASLVNLLLIGSLLSGDRPGSLVPSALLWVPASLALGAITGGLGAAIGRALPSRRGDEPDWTAVFARVAATATLVLLAVGGLVTSKNAGLAVVDWPSTYGYHMFLYPLERMVGDVFYEHAHRLFGSFVGLAVFVLFVRIVAGDRRKWVRGAAAAALLLVVLQGALGGLRVTGRFTTSVAPEDMRPSTGLAMVHGFTGQVFFALVAALAAFTTPTWRAREERDGRPLGAPNTDATIALVLVAALLVQLALGVHVRHAGRGLLMHIVGAAGVASLGVLTGVRLLAQAHVSPILRRAGAALLGHVGSQLALGIAAFVATGASLAAGASSAASSVSAPAALANEPLSAAAIIFPTLHQTVGALLLANATLACLWCRRLLSPPD